MSQSNTNSKQNKKNNKSNQPDIRNLMAKLRLNDGVNSKEWPFDDKRLKHSKYFVIKSFTEDDVHRAVKYKVWCSTFHGNKKLQTAWEKQQKYSEGKTAGDVYLFFSVNASGYFCGVAKMVSNVNYDSEKTQNLWHVDEKNEGGSNCKWRGYFDIEWIYLKDIPNNKFKSITVPQNYHRPVSHSRDSQPVESREGIRVLKLFHDFKEITSLLDDFDYYEKLEAKQRTQINDACYQMKKKEEQVVEIIKNMKKEKEIEDQLFRIENSHIRPQINASDSETFLRKLQMGKTVEWNYQNPDQQRHLYDNEFPQFKITTPNTDNNTRDTGNYTESYEEKENRQSFPSVRDYLRPSCHEYLFSVGVQHDQNENAIRNRRRPNALQIRNPDGSDRYINLFE